MKNNRVTGLGTIFIQFARSLPPPSYVHTGEEQGAAEESAGTPIRQPSIRPPMLTHNLQMVLKRNDGVKWGRGI